MLEEILHQLWRSCIFHTASCITDGAGFLKSTSHGKRLDLYRFNPLETPQETPELVPDGETPQNVAIVVFDDLVNQVMTSKLCFMGI